MKASVLDCTDISVMDTSESKVINQSDEHEKVKVSQFDEHEQLKANQFNEHKQVEAKRISNEAIEIVSDTENDEEKGNLC